MSARPTWKGVLKISLVTIPIKVFPATDSSEAISFNQLHQECQTRVQQKKWCAHCQREVPNAEIVKGFEFEKGRYVVMTDDDFDRVKPESTHIIDVTRVADGSKLDPLFVDRSYYLGPDGDRAGEPFAVISAALRGQVGIGKLAIYGREYVVAVRPAVDVGGAVLLLHTLHHDAEIRSAHDLIADVPTKVSLQQVKLAKQLLASFTQPKHQALPLAGFTDDYKAGLQKVIDAKIAGEEIVEPKAVEAPNVVSLKDALSRSLQLVQKAPAKVVMSGRRDGKRKRA